MIFYAFYVNQKRFKERYPIINEIQLPLCRYIVCIVVTLIVLDRAERIHQEYLPLLSERKFKEEKI